MDMAPLIENMHHDPGPTPAEMLMAAEEFDADADADETIYGVPPDAIALILRALVFRRGSRVKPISGRFWRCALTRLAALAWCCDPLVRQHDQKTIAEALDVCRATLSAEIVKVRDLGALGCHGGKSQSARKSYSQRQSAIWRSRREAPAGGHIEPGQTKTAGKRPKNGSKPQAAAAG
jgi:hypothetical protein